MSVVKNRALRLSAVYLIVSMGLGACASSNQTVPVQNVPASTSSPQGVQAVTQLNALQAEIRELRNLLEEQQFELENLRQRQQDLFQGLDQRLRVAEAMQQGGNIINPDGTVTTPSLLPPISTDGSPPPGQVPGVVDPAEDVVFAAGFFAAGFLAGVLGVVSAVETLSAGFSSLAAGAFVAAALGAVVAGFLAAGAVLAAGSALAAAAGFVALVAPFSTMSSIWISVRYCLCPVKTL